MSLLLLYNQADAPVTNVYPDPADVRLGIEYGPNGDDYVGTLTGGGPTADEIALAVVNRDEFKAVKAIVYDPTTAAGGRRVELSNGKFLSIDGAGVRKIEDS